ncbi:YagK/YfjJ domain-containing protein [Vibrio astriarenae]
MSAPQIILNPERRNTAHFLYKGGYQPIFFYEGGINIPMLRGGFEQIDKYFSYYSKVTIVLAQLHMKIATKGNEAISQFIKLISSALKAHYQNRYIAYMWAREQSSPDAAQHYHVALMVNGHKCQSSYIIDQLCRKIWGQVTNGGFAFRPRRRMFRLDRYGHDTFLKRFRMRLSYAAKNRTKEHIPKGVRKYGVGQLSYNQRYTS